MDVQPGLASKGSLVGVGNTFTIDLRKKARRWLGRIRVERVREEAPKRRLVSGEGDFGNITLFGGWKGQKQPGAQLGHPAVPDHDAAIFHPGIQ
ncbi:hypothetical protein [uncultured Roseibium sp.]|uniref:hypothetical protein n=1 Tax=uncultured Roseibium sp. TaxID=1936171 RepID=UPI00260F73B1|nr:hypothetical protein [uncultured Roseibium sp.]